MTMELSGRHMIIARRQNMMGDVFHEALDLTEPLHMSRMKSLESNPTALFSPTLIVDFFTPGSPAQKMSPQKEAFNENTRLRRLLTDARNTLADETIDWTQGEPPFVAALVARIDAALATGPHVQFFDANGEPVAGEIVKVAHSNAPIDQEGAA